MAKANLYNMAGQQVGEIELSEAVFGIEPNQAVVHEVVKNHLANCRQGTQSALTRAEVSGGGKKPWRQKGTGHARQGSTRAPQWTHGGIVFAPKPRDYSYTLNKKVKRLALKSALSAKAASGDILVVDGLKLDEIKTKTMRDFLNAAEAGKSVVITPEVGRDGGQVRPEHPRRGHHHRQGPQRVRHRKRQAAWWSIRPPWPSSRRCSRNDRL